jgi:hypothetical protein
MSEDTKEKNLWEKFMDTLKNELSDLSYIEIVTAAGDPKTEIDPNNDARDIVAALRSLEKVRALARTRIELDGDIGMLVPTKDDGSLSINDDILNIHKQNVLKALEILVNIARGTSPDISQLAKDIIPIKGP